MVWWSRDAGEPTTVAGFQRKLIGPVVVLPLLSFVVLMVAEPVGDEPADPFALVALAAAVVLTAIGVALSRRRLPVEEPSAQAFVKRTFIAVGCNNLGAMLAFVSVFVSEAGAWPFLAASIVGLVGYALLWPTSARVDAARADLASRGVETAILDRGA